MRRLGDFLHLVMLVGFEVSAVVLLHRMGTQPWLRLSTDPDVLRAMPVEDMFAAVLRLMALGCAWWLLGGTVLYCVARASRVPAAVRAAGIFAPAGVRRVADRSVAVALVGSAMLGGVTPALAAAISPTPAVADATPSEAASPALSSAANATTAWAGAMPPAVSPVASLAPSPTVAAASPPATVQPADTGGTAMPSDVTVTPGDNLWRLSAQWLGQATGRDPAAIPASEIAPYWAKVVQANRAQIRSGDPNLIFPGEQVEVPPMPGRGDAHPTTAPAQPAEAAAADVPAAPPAAPEAAPAPAPPLGRGGFVIPGLPLPPMPGS